MNDGFYDAFAVRQDLPSINVSESNLITFNKIMSELNKIAKDEAKPDRCLICGREITKFCNSHTVPKYCLKEIATEGKLLTTAAIMESNLLHCEVGVKEAATFKQVCSKCDTEYFKLYETPETLLRTPSSQVMGQIAAKNMLREISKARRDLALEKAKETLFDASHNAKTQVRAMDAQEDERAFKEAVRIGGSSGNSNVYHLIYHAVLPYTAPFAFQQTISPLSDFDGGCINNLFNPSTRYRIEPIHVCVLPSKGNTVVMAFRNEKAKRFRAFERQLKSLDESEKLQAIVKLIFAYSEDVFISKQLPSSILHDERLKHLASMNTIYFGLGDSDASYRKVILNTALQDFAINNLPDPPELLSEESSIKPTSS